MDRRSRKINEPWVPLFLIAVAFIVSGFSVYVSTYRPLSSFENTLLQAFSIALSVSGSFLFGKQSAVDAARQIIKPHARSAFRRLMSLYRSLSRVADEIERASERRSREITIAKLKAIVLEKLATADDALEDWGDIVPEEVEELRSNLKTKGEQRSTQ